MTASPKPFGKKNSNNRVATENLQPAFSPLPCDSHHPYYHYQSSAQYTWLAASLHILGYHVEAAKAYKNAIFQDHLNQEAILGKTLAESHGPYTLGVPAYDKHPDIDALFCSLSGQPPSEASAPHDEAMQAYHDGYFADVLRMIQPDSAHSNSHYLMGRCYFLLGHYEETVLHLNEAVRISHIHHETYHRHAAVQHVLRGKWLLYRGHIDLAIADFTKALDLDHGNRDAKRTRALAYKTKGSIRLAEEDERSLA